MALDFETTNSSIQVVTGSLCDFIDFKNGKSSPERLDGGEFDVFGSNGVIGKADITNADENTLVIGRVGSYCGSVHYSPNQCWVTDNAIIGVAKTKKEARFWYYKLSALELNNYRTGSGQPLLNQQILNSIEVSVPALEDDRLRIAKILSAFDEKIENNRRINQTLEQMAQAIFKSWFVDFDLVKAKIAAKAEGRDPLRAAMSAISGKTDAELDALSREQYDTLAATAALFPDEMEESESGEIPMGWMVGYLGELCELNPASWSAKTLPGTVQYVDLANAKNGEIIETQTLSGTEIPGRARRILELGDTIVGTVRPGNRSFALVSENDLTGSTGFAVLHPNQLNLREVVYLVATSDSSIDRLAHLADGGAYPAVRSELVIAETAVIPNSDLFKAFNHLTGPMFNQILTNRKANKPLSDLRDTLLPKLLSGELLVSIAENLVSTTGA